MCDYKLLGRVDERNGYYNFSPIFQIEDDELRSLSRSEIDEILEDSQYPNINLSFPRNGAEIMEEHLSDALFQILKLDTDKLDINVNSKGEINPTKFKIDGLECLNNSELYDINKDGFYRALYSREIQSNVKETNIIELDAPALVDEQYVLLEVADEDIF